MQINAEIAENRTERLAQRYSEPRSLLDVNVACTVWLKKRGLLGPTLAEMVHAEARARGAFKAPHHGGLPR